MIYTRYFASVTKENGQPNLSPDQFRRMMNIVFVEGILSGMGKIKEMDTTQYYKYDTLIFKQDTVLTDLTGNLKPGELLKEMHRLSRV
jgi:hypothetical protein